MGVSVETFRRVALEDDEGAWEYHCGRLVRKPPMTMPHNEQGMELAAQILAQLDRSLYAVRVNSGHMGVRDERYMVADVAVMPRSYLERYRDRRAELEEYSEPFAFVAEVWSRSTGDYDVEEKFPAYRERGGLEIWRIHPNEKTVTAWRRPPNGAYSESVHTEGRLEIASLPGVTVDLELLFAY